MYLTLEHAHLVVEEKIERAESNHQIRYFLMVSVEGVNTPWFEISVSKEEFDEVKPHSRVELMLPVTSEPVQK